MQTVIHDYANVSPIFNQIEWLYTHISDNYGKALISHVLDTSFDDLYEILEEYIPGFSGIELKDYHLPELDLLMDYQEKAKDNVIVCISGGKDSVALTKYLIDMGYNVYLYHMRGINKVYPDEYKAVIDVANYFNVPYYIDTVVLSGTQKFVEHPMKNMIIANGAIHYGIREKIGINLAFGNFNESYLEYNDFAVCAGDCMDMWYAYEKIIRTIIPHFTMMIPLHNNEESLEIIEKNLDLLPLSVSCMSPYRFREDWKKRTEKKYQIELMPHRCGCCLKCALEAIYFMDREVLPYNEAYYIHCIEILYNTKVKESGIKEWTLKELWNEYLFYPIQESRAWEKLKDAVIQNGKVKCITQIVKG